MKIVQVNPIHCYVDPPRDFKLIEKVFEYESTFFKQGAYHKERKTQQSYFAHHPHRGWFLAGLMNQVFDYCDRNGISVDYSAYSIPEEEILKRIQPSLPGIDFRPDQPETIEAITNVERGIVKAPTGSGKTVLAAGVISQFPDALSMVVVHTQALFAQTIKELQGWFNDVGWIGKGEFNPEKITVCMIQTANMILTKDPKAKKYLHPNYKQFVDLLGDLDIIIIDEAHHLAVKSGHYTTLMELTPAQYRIGFTATINPPKNKRLASLVGEGYLGPVVEGLKMEIGIKEGILAKPRLKLIPVPFSQKIADHKTYRDLYKHGVILNKSRNRLIAVEANKVIKEGKSVLIMITDVVNNHGEIIKELLWELFGEEAFVVHGGTKIDLREEIKQALKSKDIKCVIVTSAWREGVNIPSLDCVINAIGGKSDIIVLQTIGRGLRSFEGKEEILLIDFLDPYNFLAQHTIERLRIYSEIGILNH